LIHLTVVVLLRAACRIFGNWCGSHDIVLLSSRPIHRDFISVGTCYWYY